MSLFIFTWYLSIMKDLSTLSVRIKKALIVTNTTQAKLSRQISVKPQVINFLCEN